LTPGHRLRADEAMLEKLTLVRSMHAPTRKKNAERPPNQLRSHSVALMPRPVMELARSLKPTQDSTGSGTPVTTGQIPPLAHPSPSHRTTECSTAGSSTEAPS